METLIRPMRRADVAPAADVVRRGNWGDREAFLAFAVGHAECHPLIAEISGEIVGSGVGTVNGRVGWVGMIFVDEARRRTGIGQAITEAVVEDLRGAGCETLVLVATPLGRPIYERLGFEVEDSYAGFSAPSAPARSKEGRGDRARPVELSDLDALGALDAWATGEDRGHLFRAVLATGRSAAGIVVRGASRASADGSLGTLAAFTLPSGWGGWPAIARATDTGVALLEHRRRLAAPGSTVRTAILESNREALAALEAASWERTWSGVRMRLGPPLDWHPEAIWGQFNLGLG